MKKIEFDKEEQEILDSFERGEWKSVLDVKSEIDKHRAYARNTLKKDKRVNIRISSKDLAEIQTLAIEDGLPYQTLISSILHRYVTGRLIDKARPNHANVLDPQS
jgi:predicted DNA binding CopG/RHH family protein